MANDCLVTRLEGVVDNDNLLCIDEFFINVKSGTGDVTNYVSYSFNTTLPGTKKITFTVIGNGGIAESLAGLENPQTTIDIYKDSMQHNIFFTNGNYKVKVSGKYYIGAILKINPNGAKNGICNINIEDIAYCEYLGALWAPRTGSIGNISNLGKLTRLVEVRLDYSSVFGTIESFVQAQRAAGRTSTANAITFNAVGTDVTFDGNALESSQLSWTASTITLGEKTINA